MNWGQERPGGEGAQRAPLRKRARFNSAKGAWGKNPGLTVQMNNPGVPGTKGTPMAAATAPSDWPPSSLPTAQCITRRLTLNSQDNLRDRSISAFTDEDWGSEGLSTYPGAELSREHVNMNWPHKNVYKCEEYSSLGRAERFRLEISTKFNNSKTLIC